MNEEIEDITGGAKDGTKFAANTAREALSASDKVLKDGMKRVSVAKKVVLATTATTVPSYLMMQNPLDIGLKKHFRLS